MSNTEYRDDGEILESDGKIPAWFNILFIASVIIGVSYGINYHFISENSMEKKYSAEVAEYQKANPPVVAELTKEGANPFRENAEAIAAGGKTFATYCATCHKADGTGLIGPNLMDKTWLHGNKDAVLYKLVMNGVTVTEVKQPQKPPQAGPMPPHKDSLGSRKVLEVLAWLATKNSTIEK